MDPIGKEVPESMKLQGPSKYILWSYKVKMILLQEGLWKYVEAAEEVDSGETSAESTGVTSTPNQQILAPSSDEQKYRAG